MSDFYEEENQIEDLNVEADRVIAMNPSGIIENFETHQENVNGKKFHCDGNKCVILGDNDIVEDNLKNNSKNITYYILILIFSIALCALAYFLYKKYYCSS